MNVPDGGTPAEANFEGRAERRCREHRTVGPHRAWCHDDSEWCYPELPCRGCLPEDPQDAYDRGRTDGAAAQRDADIKLARDRKAVYVVWHKDIRRYRQYPFADLLAAAPGNDTPMTSNPRGSIALSDASERARKLPVPETGSQHSHDAPDAIQTQPGGDTP